MCEEVEANRCSFKLQIGFLTVCCLPRQAVGAVNASNEDQPARRARAGAISTQQWQEGLHHTR